MKASALERAVQLKSEYLLWIIGAIYFLCQQLQKNHLVKIMLGASTHVKQYCFCERVIAKGGSIMA